MSNNYPNSRCGRPTPPPQPTTFICRITGPIPTNGLPGGSPDAVLGIADGPNGGPGSCNTPVTFLCRIFGPVGDLGGPGGPGGGPGPRFDQGEEFTMGQFPGAVLGLGGGPGQRLPVPGLYTLQVLAPVTESNGPGGGPGGPGGPGGHPCHPCRPCRPWCGPGGPGGPGGRPGMSC